MLDIVLAQDKNLSSNAATNAAHGFMKRAQAGTLPVAKKLILPSATVTDMEDAGQNPREFPSSWDPGGDLQWAFFRCADEHSW